MHSKDKRCWFYNTHLKRFDKFIMKIKKIIDDQEDEDSTRDSSDLTGNCDVDMRRVEMEKKYLTIKILSKKL